MSERTLEQDVARIFNPLTSPNPTIALKTVTLVGGYSEGTFDHSDDTYLFPAVASLKEQGVPLSTQFSMSSINLDRQRRDFLVEAPPSDLLVFCFLHHPLRSLAAHAMAAYFRPSGVSPLHFEPDIWPTTIQKTGAKAVYVIGGMAELSENHVRPSDFITASRTLDIVQENALLLRRDYAQTLINSGELSEKQTANLKQKLQAGQAYA